MCLVRDYKPQDLESTVRLMQILSNLINVEFNEENWNHQIRIRCFDPQFRTLVAEEKGTVVGMCFADIKHDETGHFYGIIRNVIVDPQFRKKGVATNLIMKAIKIFADLKVNGIKVHVLEQIKDVIPLFEKFDFQCSTIIMEKDVIKIREYKESDYEATRNMMQLYSELIHVPFNEVEWKQTLRIMLRNPAYRILIAEDEDVGVVTGLAFINITSDETGLTIGSLPVVIVAPKYRRRGFGKALLIRAIELLNVLNVDKIRVPAHLEMRDNLKVFEDVGFHKAAYVMEIKLPES
ncbi:MAG: GNAT family N-acetyltransferase [Candidatus Helarchaeota archaeon]